MDKNNKNFKNARQISPPKNGQNSKINEKSKKFVENSGWIQNLWITGAIEAKFAKIFFRDF